MTARQSTEPHLWYPYAAMDQAGPYPKVVKADGMFIELADGKLLVDCISSWWCVIHGYNHPYINEKLTGQLSRFSHVMMGGLKHEASEELAIRLAAKLPGDLNHVFFSDSGSVGVEVAMKMAIQYWMNVGVGGKTKFLTLTGGYHGDTFQTMSVTNPDGSFHRTFAGILPDHFYAPRPEGGLACSPSQLDMALRKLEDILKSNRQDIAAFILEPLLQGAGGYYYYPAEYLEAAHRLCQKYEVLFIFDEVATGFGRTGKLFATDALTFQPDIIVLGKALTAGYLGLAATVANDRVFDSFLGKSDKVLMHGPTFMGNAMACTAALANLDLTENPDFMPSVARISRDLAENFGRLKALEHPAVAEVRWFGASAVIEFKPEYGTPEKLAQLQEFCLEKGFWVRPFNSIVYLAPAYLISGDQIADITSVLADWLTQIKS